MVLLGEEAPDLHSPALDLRAPALDLLSGAAPKSVLAPATLPRCSGTRKLPRRHPAPRLDAMEKPWILSSYNWAPHTERRMKTLCWCSVLACRRPAVYSRICERCAHFDPGGCHWG